MMPHLKKSKVVVIILNWNGRQFLKDCLNSVLKQTYSNYKVLLVDNNSTDGSVEFVRQKFPSIKIIKNDKNYGFAEGNNIGIRFALRDPKVEYIALLNNDTKVKKNWLEELVKANADIAQSKVLDMDGRISCTGILYSKNGLAFDRKYSHLDKDPFGASGVAVMFKRKVLEDIKMDDDFLDSDFFCYFEDLDISFRARLRGWKVKYVPTSVVYHLGSATAGKGSKFSIYYGNRNNLWVIIKNMPTYLLLKYWLQIVLAQILSVIFHVLKGNGKIIIKSKMDALRYLPLMIKKRNTIQKRRIVKAKDLEKLLVNMWFPK